MKQIDIFRRQLQPSPALLCSPVAVTGWLPWRWRLKVTLPHVPPPGLAARLPGLSFTQGVLPNPQAAEKPSSPFCAIGAAGFTRPHCPGAAVFGCSGAAPQPGGLCWGQELLTPVPLAGHCQAGKCPVGAEPQFLCSPGYGNAPAASLVGSLSFLSEKQGKAYLGRK